ncbi:MAG: Sir2 family NAD-dependent protein deacetylase [Pseudomonadota bacterium]
MSAEEIHKLGQAIESSRKIVCFTGAGISTESGIPDFRSPGTGLWNKIKPIQFQEFVASEEARLESWRRKFSADRTMENATPNQGHYALARLVERGICTGIITQNIDNLHQNSGVPDDKVVELHGNATFANCLSCGVRYELAALEAQFNQLQRVEPCSACGGIIKTATISFGQSMPEHEMHRAQMLVDDCDLMIVLGSSLTVYPAASFPEYAQRAGAQLAIVNREETPLDPFADIVIHEQIGPTMAMVAGLN